MPVKACGSSQPRTPDVTPDPCFGKAGQVLAAWGLWPAGGSPLETSTPEDG